MGTDPVIQTANLSRYFGRKCAVNSLSLTVPRGCVFAFLGRNGSGKTTTIRMLLGLLDPTRGSASVLGHDCRDLPPEVRARIGYLAENHPLYGWMRVRDAAAFQASFHPTWKQDIFEGVIRHFRLDPKARAGHLSRGERAGLALALTLAPEPELLILDDPALGLDPVARRSLLESMIYVTRKADRTILFSSHLLSDVERVADYIAILDHSVLRAQCPVDVFRERVKHIVLRFASAPPHLPPIPGVLQTQRFPNELRLVMANLTDATMSQLHSLGALSVDEVPISLEDAFIAFLADRGEKSFFLSDTTGATASVESAA